MAENKKIVKAGGNIVQSDWNQNDSSKMDYIHNKPENIASLEDVKIVSDKLNNDILNKISTEANADALVQRDSNGHLNLPEDMTTSGVYTAVHKAYLETRLEEAFEIANNNITQTKTELQNEIDADVLIETNRAKEAEENINNKINNLSNPNLLVNGELKINTYKKSSYTTINSYTVDKWKMWSYAGTFTVATKTVTAGDIGGNVILSQWIENDIDNKDVTLSAKINGILYSVSGNTTNTLLKEFNTGYIRLIKDANQNNQLRVDIGTKPNNSNQIDYIKLEIGNMATPISPIAENNELYNMYRPSNPNLLINSDFRIHQRSGFLTTNKTYAYDRWRMNGGTNLSARTVDHISFTSSAPWQGITQPLTGMGHLAGQTVTFSAKLSLEVSSVLVLGMRVLKYGQIATTQLGDIFPAVDITPSINSITITLPSDFTDSDILMVYIWSRYADQNIKIYWAKLEQGNIATPYVPRDYNEELALCLPYFQKIGGNSINRIALCKKADTLLLDLPLLSAFRTTSGYKATVKQQSLQVYPISNGTAGTAINTSSSSTSLESINGSTASFQITASGAVYNTLYAINGLILMEIDNEIYD